MPDSFFIISKENLALARDEVIAIAKSYDRHAEIQMFSNVVIIRSKTSWKKIADRASFVKIAGQVLTELADLASDKDGCSLLQNAKSFACKAVNLTPERADLTETERDMGNTISKFSKIKADLKDPDITIYLIITESQRFFGFSTRFSKSQRPKKISGHPHELDWKLSRAMVNLAGVREGDTICDPFCGTGTGLLEAESMGIHAIGIDYDAKMSKISEDNLGANGYKSKVINAGFEHMAHIQDKFDGLVTDLPYGRASKSSEKPEILIQKFISAVPKKKRMVLMYKDGADKGLEIQPAKKYKIYRHKSLTRTILVR